MSSSLLFFSSALPRASSSVSAPRRPRSTSNQAYPQGQVHSLSAATDRVAEQLATPPLTPPPPPPLPGQAAAARACPSSALLHRLPPDTPFLAANGSAQRHTSSASRCLTRPLELRVAMPDSTPHIAPRRHRSRPTPLATGRAGYLGPVWDRGCKNRDAYKPNAAPRPLLRFWHA